MIPSPVVSLSAYRMSKEKPKQGDRWFCTRCDSNEFHLKSSGDVNCAKCGAKIKNLLVGMK